MVELSIGVEVAVADRGALLVAMEQSRRVRARLDRFDIDVAARLVELASEAPAMFPERVVADVTRVSVMEASRQFERAKTLATIPALGEATRAGRSEGPQPTS